MAIMIIKLRSQKCFIFKIFEKSYAWLKWDILRPQRTVQQNKNISEN